MESLTKICCLIRLIARHILMFIRDFIFHELVWFIPTGKDLDNASTKIQNVNTLQHSADFLVFFLICGLLFAFMILSTSTYKNEASSYNTGNIETISMVFEEDSSWYSRSSSARFNCCHACGDSISSSRNFISDMKDLCPSICKTIMLPRPGTSSYNMRRYHSQHLKKKRNHVVPLCSSESVPERWLVRRTRSGHIYGRYPTYG